MTNELVKLPEEVEQLALSVSEEKRNEVKTVLNDVFKGTSDWKKQVDGIKVKDINDIMSIQLAEVARKNSKTARLNAEKIFDAKRSEVQSQMQSYKTEDALWLKAKQTMQILFKDIEETAKYKADFVKRHEIEQLKLRNDLRYEKVLKFIPDEEISILEINVMSNETFNIYLSGIEKVYNDKIEAEKKAEQDRIAKEKAEQAERLRIAKENEQLKKEAIKRERLEKIESDKRAKAEQDRLAKAEAERKERERLEAIERKKHEAELQKERDAKAKIQKELEAKAEAERKRNKLIQDEKAEQIAKEKAALLAPDKDKLNEFSKTIRNIKFPDVKSLEALNILENVQNLLTKTSNYIDEKSEQLA